MRHTRRGSFSALPIEMQILNGSEVDPPPYGRSQSLPRGRMGAPLQLIGNKVAGNMARDTPLLLTLYVLMQAYLFGGYVKEGYRYLRDFWYITPYFITGFR